MSQYHLFHLNAAGAISSNIALASARLVFGCGANDDILIEAGDVMPGHAQAVYADQVLTLLSATGLVYVNGELVTQFPCDIPADTVFSLGREQHFFYGAANSAVPALPTLPLVPSDVPSDAVSAQAVPQEPLQPARRPLSYWLSRGFLALTVGMGTLMILVIVNEPAAVPVLTNEQKNEPLKALLATPPYRHVQIRHQNILGYVNSTADFERLNELAQQSSLQVLVVDPKTLQQQLLALTEKTKITAKTQLEDKQLRITFTGLVHPDFSENQISTALQDISQRIEPLRLEWNLQLYDPNTITKQVRTLLAKEKATQFFNVRWTGQALVISGVYAPATQAAVTQTLAQVHTQFPGFPVQMAAQLVSDAQVQIVNVSISNKAALATLTRNGEQKQFSENDTVWNLGKLNLIRQDGVFLEYQSAMLYIPFRR